MESNFSIHFSILAPRPALLWLCGLFLSGIVPDALAQQSLPLGDGKITTTPSRGYIYSCDSQFHGGGAFRDGPWISGNNWYPDRKIHVSGDVAWPDAQLSIHADNGKRVVSGNGLPRNYSTGIFPVMQSDPAFQYDRNPNSILRQSLFVSLPMLPVTAAAPSCLNMGMIGVSLDGVAIFNGLDGQGRDAVAHEIQDHCDGHPEPRGQYHFHGWSDCMDDSSGGQGKHSALAGYALDGFGIYGPHGEKGVSLTNADLDECHGHSHKVEWDGQEIELYHYHFTREYPYSLSCYRGTPVRQEGAHRGGRRPPPPGMGFPPPPPGDFPPPIPQGF